jgi:hypothetical protein
VKRARSVYPSADALPAAEPPARPTTPTPSADRHRPLRHGAPATGLSPATDGSTTPSLALQPGTGWNALKTSDGMDFVQLNTKDRPLWAAVHNP